MPRSAATIKMTTRVALIVALHTGTIFEHNGSRAVSLSSDTRFPRKVKKVNVRARGSDRILTP